MRRLLPLLALPLLLAAAVPVSAAEREAYTPAAMAAAQAAGKPVLVHVVASWCSTCATQIPVVMSLLAVPKYKDFVLLIVDFDKQKSALRTYKVQAQSTFVVFKGQREVARSTGETARAALEALFDRAS